MCGNSGGRSPMNAEPNHASQTQLWMRRALLRRVAGTALGAASLSTILACGPGAAPTPTQAPAAPTSPPKPAATTAPAAVATAAPAKPAAAPTAAPAKPAAAPTAAPASAAAAATGTLRYASADFGGESMDPI